MIKIFLLSVLLILSLSAASQKKEDSQLAYYLTYDKQSGLLTVEDWKTGQVTEQHISSIFGSSTDPAKYGYDGKYLRILACSIGIASLIICLMMIARLSKQQEQHNIHRKGIKVSPEGGQHA